MATATPDLPARTKLHATISRVEDGEDLVGWAEGQLLAFGERLYGEVEPPATRASLDDRISRFTRRIRPLVNGKDVLIEKATVPIISSRTGEPTVAALAFWHLPGAKVDNLQKNTEEQVAADPEAFEGYDWKKWNEMLEKYDVVRRRVMGDTPHWYLGPLWTHPDYQGQGLAGQLLHHAISLAEAADPPELMYLEASPAGMPVYARYGWERIEGTETAMLRKPRAEGERDTVMPLHEFMIENADGSKETRNSTMLRYGKANGGGGPSAMRLTVGTPATTATQTVSV